MGDEPFDQYLQRMRQPAEMGGHPEIQAMAELFCRPIHVFAAGSDNVRVYQCGVEGNAAEVEANPPILLLYTNGNHYDSLVDTAHPSVGVGLGMPGLEQAEVAVETKVANQVMEQSDLDEVEKKIL